MEELPEAVQILVYADKALRSRPRPGEKHLRERWQ